MPLNDKQRSFAEEYLVDLNATQAAIRAGYSPDSAACIGYENLSKREIADFIAEAQQARSDRTQITADRVLAELGCLGLYDPAIIASAPMAGPEDIANLPEAARRAIVGWGWDKEGRFVLKLSPKVPALVEIGKHLGIAQRSEITGKNSGPIEVEQPTRSRAALVVLSLLHQALEKEAE